ncbi:BTAD domain-containing putative transcriptional regulator [Plantactinospora siamensis]|uniref:BTAD domain-containing putative transcriptional regulator n=1 Tax=Plantactinospora siamensis TaxID=555372 RepID=A0ABV6P4N6_9ACTN
MRIQVLGPLRVWDGGRWTAVNAPHHRIVLSVLLAEAGRPVPKDRLVHDIWGERPTRTAASAVNGYVMRLRRLLRAGGAGDVLTRPAGYELTADDDAVDVRVFERMLRTGKRHVAGGQVADGVRQLEAALALWRGPALADVPGTLLVASEADRLDQLRLAAREELLGAQLELGRHAEVVEELSALVRENPLRERLCRHLMIALYRCGRRAEALDAYRRVRAVLTAETGLEPGPELQAVEQAVLTDDRGLAAPAVRPVAPAQLPAAVADFAGRHDVLAALDAVARGRPAPPVVIAGLAGVGKTALAVRWAHAVRADFPDGQLFVDLRGHSLRPAVQPMEALAGFLVALGVPPEQIPGQLDEAVALYRSVTAVRRILVLLDNAGHPDQVRPLLPGGPGCLVLITSRDQLRGLTAREGAVGLPLEVLPVDEARALLRTLLPGAADADAAELARLCGYLPLAIRIAAANLRAEATPVARYNRRLAAGDRLATLGVRGDAMSATGTAFDLSYGAHPPAARRLFRLLGIAPGDTVAAPAAAALAGLPVAEAGALLDALATAHLLERAAPDRYRWHDLVRLYARRRCLAEDPDRDAALARLYRYYLRTMDRAARLLYPTVVRLPLPAAADPRRDADADPAPAGDPATDADPGPDVDPDPDADPATDADPGPDVDPDPDADPDLGAAAGRRFASPAEALAWVEAERANLTAAIRSAGPAHREAAWRLTDQLRWHLDFTAPSAEWLPVTEAALGHARADNHPLGQAAAHLSRATVLLSGSRYDEAIADFHRVLDFARDGGWAEGQTCALSNLAHVYFETGRLDLAARHTIEALDIDTRIGRTAGQLSRLANLGNIRLQQGRLAEAVEYCQRVIELEGQVGEWHGQGTAHGCLGEAYLLLGRHEDALGYLTEALARHRRARARSCEADTLRLLAAGNGAAGRLVEAQALAAQALLIAREVGDRWVEAQALLAQADLELTAGDAEPAGAHLRQVLALARGDGGRHAEAQALIGLARAARLGGADQLDEARAYGTAALTICREFGYRLLEQNALAVLP